MALIGAHTVVLCRGQCIPLPRRTAADLTVVDRALTSFASTKSDLWLAIYPEGTFVDTLEKDKVLVPNSNEFCKANNLPPHTHLLVQPTLLRDMNRSVQ